MNIFNVLVVSSNGNDSNVNVVGNVKNKHDDIVKGMINEWRLKAQNVLLEHLDKDSDEYIKQMDNVHFHNKYEIKDKNIKSCIFISSSKLY